MIRSSRITTIASKMLSESDCAGLRHQSLLLIDFRYYSAHKPLHAQEEIVGHSVRTFYLLAAAADLGGAFTSDAMRLWEDCVDHKMYVTGGVGTEPRVC